MKVSIITVCYNSGKTITNTLDSVLNQKYDNIEYIIIDGKSSDNTLDIIKNYQKKFDNKLKYISEKDNGIYDAMNKGIRLATGDIIGILNSDDVLANDEVVGRIVQEFCTSKCDAAYSDLLYVDFETMKIPIRYFISHKPSKLFGWHPAHPTLYVKKKIYDDIGNYNCNYQIAADYDFMLRMIDCDKYKLAYIKEVLIHMRSGGISTHGISGYFKNFKESYVVLKNNHRKCALLLNICRIFKTFWQGLIAKIK